MADSEQAEMYEQQVQAIRQANQPILEGFEHCLRQAGLREETVRAHVDNLRLFEHYLLLYVYSLCRLDEATEGAIYDFLADWFPRKALWASVSSMKVSLATFKKFFQWMREMGLVSPQVVADVLSTLKTAGASGTVKRLRKSSDISVDRCRAPWYFV
jgi:site-specific recombinase XerD